MKIIFIATDLLLCRGIFVLQIFIMENTIVYDMGTSLKKNWTFVNLCNFLHVEF